MGNSNKNGDEIPKHLVYAVLILTITVIIATIIFYPIKDLMIEYGQSYILINSLMVLNQTTFIISLCIGLICGFFSLHYLKKLHKRILIKIERFHSNRSRKKLKDLKEY